MSRTLLDTHVHLWDLVATPQPWINGAMATIDRDFRAQDLSEQLSLVGVPRAIVVQADHSLAETRWLLSQASESDEITGVVGWVDVAGDVHAQLDEVAGMAGAQALVGIRHLAHIDADASWLERPDVAAGIAVLGEYGLSFDLVIRPWQVRQAAALAARAPETSVVLDHLAKPPLASGDIASWQADLAALAEFPNVRAKISGLTIEAAWNDWAVADLAPAVHRALELFGPSRLVFGSDWPLIRLTRGGYAGWIEAYLELTAGLSPDEQLAIDSGTAFDAYGVTL